MRYVFLFLCILLFFSWVRFKMIILIAVFAGNHHCSHQVVYVLSFKFLVRTQTVIRSFLILAVAELPFNCGIFHWIQCGLWPCDDELFSALGFSPRKPKPALTSIQWKPDYFFNASALQQWLLKTSHYEKEKHSADPHKEGCLLALFLYDSQVKICN